MFASRATFASIPPRLAPRLAPLAARCAPPAAWGATLRAALPRAAPAWARRAFSSESFLVQKELLRQAEEPASYIGTHQVASSSVPFFWSHQFGEPGLLFSQMSTIFVGAPRWQFGESAFPLMRHSPARAPLGGDFIDYKTSMTTYQDPLRCGGGGQLGPGVLARTTRCCRHSPTVGSYGVVLSYVRGTPVQYGGEGAKEHASYVDTDKVYFGALVLCIKPTSWLPVPEILCVAR